MNRPALLDVWEVAVEMPPAGGASTACQKMTVDDATVGESPKASTAAGDRPSRDGSRPSDDGSGKPTNIDDGRSVRLPIDGVRAPIKIVDGRRWSPGVYRALRLMGKTLEVAWERAFV